MGKEFSSYKDLAENVFPGNLETAELYEAVPQVNEASFLHALRELFVVDRDAFFSARDIFDGQGDLFPFVKHNGFFFELAYADLGTREVCKDGHDPIKLFRYLADPPDYLSVALEVPVGKVDPCHVHAFKHHFPEHALGRGGRAYGAHDLCLVIRKLHIFTAF